MTYIRALNPRNPPEVGINVYAEETLELGRRMSDPRRPGFLRQCQLLLLYQELAPSSLAFSPQLPRPRELSAMMERSPSTLPNREPLATRRC